MVATGPVVVRVDADAEDVPVADPARAARDPARRVRMLPVAAFSLASRSTAALVSRRSRAASVPRGCQKRRRMTAARMPASEATMSVSSTEIHVALTHWAIANTTPNTTVAGQVSRMPRHPSASSTMMSGTKTAIRGVWWPTMAPMCR